MGAGQQALLSKAPASSTDADATAWRDEVVTDGGTVSAGRLTLVSNYLTTLKSSPGFSTVFDHLNLYAAENAISAREDIKRLVLVTAVGSPTFTTDRSYTGSTSAYLNTLLQPNGSGNYTQNSAHFSFWLRNNKAGEDSVEMGNSTAAFTAGCNISVKWSDGNRYAALNDGNTYAGSAAAADISGHWIVSRTASNLVTVYRNGASVFTTTIASTGLPIYNYTVNGAFDSLSAGAFNFGGIGQFAMSSIGRGLSGAEALAFYNATQTYMTAVGA
jgi:hypothetical protein